MTDPERCLDLVDYLITSFGEAVRENDRGADIQTFQWTDNPAKERLVLSRRGTRRTEGCTLRIRPEVKSPRQQ